MTTSWFERFERAGEGWRVVALTNDQPDGATPAGIAAPVVHPPLAITPEVLRQAAEHHLRAISALLRLLRRTLDLVARIVRPVRAEATRSAIAARAWRRVRDRDGPSDTDPSLLASALDVAPGAPSRPAAA